MAQSLYECMFLVDGTQYAQNPQGTEDGIRAILSKHEADIVAMAPWQEGKLAYEVEGHRKGLHLLVYMKMDGSQVPLLNRTCKLSELVIRHLLLEHPQKLFDLMVQQLAGHETEHAGAVD